MPSMLILVTRCWNDAWARLLIKAAITLSAVPGAPAAAGGRVMMWGAVYGGGILCIYLGASLRQANRVVTGSILWRESRLTPVSARA
eukprot:XP_001702949.1 predicted protein [Chlamydomonas reinhardtii]